MDLAFAACSLILVGAASIWHQEGSAALWDLFSPHVVTNCIFLGLILAPAFFLSTLARGIHERSRVKILRSGGALLASVIAASLLPVPFTNNEAKNVQKTGMAREYEAQSIRVKDNSATLYQYKTHNTNPSLGPVGKLGIPESIQIGDEITVNGHSLRAQHILVKEILTDINYDGHLLGKAGETECVIVESFKNLPAADHIATVDRLWIVVEKCVPLTAATP